MATKVTYTYSGTSETFPITFDYLSSSDLSVTVNGTPVTFTITGSSVDPDPELNVDDVIVISRVTDIDDARVVFDDPSRLSEDDLNTAFNQVRYSLQEAYTAIEELTVSPGGGNLPTPTGANIFLVSQSDGSGGYQWAQKTVGQTQSILGIASAVVPTPSAGSKFIVSDASSDVYELATIAEVKTLLGINELPPAIAGRQSYFLVSNTGGTAYELISSTDSRSRLGLGNAAVLNTGTSIGNIPVLVNVNGVAGLPAVSGANLTGVQKTVDYSIWEKKPSQAILLTNEANSSTPNTGELSGSTGWVSVSSQSGAGLTLAQGPLVAGWCQTHASGVSLSPGTYIIEAESVVYGVTATVRPRIYLNNNGTVSVFTGLPHSLDENDNTDDSNDSSNANNTTRNTSWRLGRPISVRIKTTVVVTASIGNNFVALDVQRIIGKSQSRYNFAGNTNFPSARLFITKIA